MAKRNPKSRIAEKIALLITEVSKQGFDAKAELNPNNEGMVAWRKKPPTEE